MKIFIIENEDLSKLVKEINKLEKNNKGRLVGSISNYNKENKIRGESYSGVFALYSLQPTTIYYATMRESKEEL